MLRLALFALFVAACGDAPAPAERTAAPAAHEAGPIDIGIDPVLSDLGSIPTDVECAIWARLTAVELWTFHAIDETRTGTVLDVTAGAGLWAREARASCLTNAAAARAELAAREGAR